MSSKVMPIPRPALAPVVQAAFEDMLVPVGVARVVDAVFEEPVVEGGGGGPVVLAGLRTLGFHVS